MLSTRILKNFRVKKHCFLSWLRSIDAIEPLAVNKDHIFFRKTCKQKIFVTIGNFFVFFRYSRCFAKVNVGISNNYDTLAPFNYYLFY